ncbi:hypothetical protein SDC9_169609 [bioreactor metagenome]|uniref:Uncharacterized protein n=1 Tax=bioreactor metagenome TaxID=1076179 RepID=A0A645G7W5_9ZZZZ
MAGASSSTVFTVAIQYNASSNANSGKVAYIYILANSAPVATYAVNGSAGIKMATTIAGLSSATAGNGITAKQAEGTEIFVTAATAGMAVKAATLALTKTATAGVYSFKVAALDVAANEFTAIANGDTVLADYAKTLAAFTYSNTDVSATAVKVAVAANYTGTQDGNAVTATAAFANGYTPMVAGSEQTVAMNVTLTVTISGVVSTLVVPMNVTVCTLA